MSHRAPDIVEVIQGVASGGQPSRAELRVEASGLGGQLSGEAGGNLDITGETGIFRNRGERLARLARIAHRVIAVGGVEEIDVASTRVVTLVDDFAHLIEA